MRKYGKDSIPLRDLIGAKLVIGKSSDDPTVVTLDGNQDFDFSNGDRDFFVSD